MVFISPPLYYYFYYFFLISRFILDRVYHIIIVGNSQYYNNILTNLLFWESVPEFSPNKSYILIRNLHKTTDDGHNYV